MSSSNSGSSSSSVPRSPWQSPVPYLFGGLAAMLALIAFALIILFCSYWKLSGYFQNNNLQETTAGEADSGDKAPPAEAAAVEEKFLVIMAGQDMPTFLASKAPTSFNGNSTFTDNMKPSEEDLEEKTTKKKEESNRRLIEMERDSAADQVR
ncbi:protein GLUTAMINE DUMPER 2-like [Andrographis paniculata]|uniref:protein GLUTAMINE DUMPER 2-like n=1 Tax=Andrographis paniculata TaxID=175694 RepID=UPI0021E75277|nr:protein GLUTAMINE DUMPER 2-like [Andrographis paniculata]